MNRYARLVLVVGAVAIVSLAFVQAPSARGRAATAKIVKRLIRKQYETSYRQKVRFKSVRFLTRGAISRVRVRFDLVSPQTKCDIRTGRCGKFKRVSHYKVSYLVGKNGQSQWALRFLGGTCTGEVCPYRRAGDGG